MEYERVCLPQTRTTGILQAFGAPPRFGWSVEHPPEHYQIALASSDITPRGLATDAFVRKVATQLTGDTDQAPRMAALTGTLAVLGQNLPAYTNITSRVRTFGLDLAQRVMALAFPTRSQQTPSLATSDFSQRFTRHQPRIQGFGTVTDLHQDDRTDLLTMIYGPWTQVGQGFPKVADIRQMQRDLQTDRRQLTDDLPPAKLKAPYREKAERDYTLILSNLDFTQDMPILLLNNRREAGIFHGAAPPISLGPNAKRPLFRVSIENPPF